MTEQVSAEQCDRQAMVDYQNPSYISINMDVAAEVLAGKRDDDHRVQAFARHRLAAEQRGFERAQEMAGEVALGLRQANAGSFERTGAVWEAYDRATLDAHAAIRAISPERTDDE